MNGLSILKGGKQEVKKQIEQLYQFMVANDCQNKLKSYEDYFRKIGDKESVLVVSDTNTVLSCEVLQLTQIRPKANANTT